MIWPFVSRARFDDMQRMYDQRLAEKDSQIAELQKERQRLWDRFATNAIGGQVFDTIPTAAEPQVSDSPLTPEEIERRASMDRLRSLAARGGSGLGSAIEEMMAAEKLREIDAAHPAPVIPQPVSEFFGEAKREVLNGNGNH